jgi:hypothetical protein
MSWDDNWTRALVTVAAAAVGAIAAGVINAYAANRKIKEVELQYLYKLRDGYLDNARKVAGVVYIPISVALTSLFNSYERFAANIGTTAAVTEKGFRDDFETECLRYLGTIDDLLARGADAYLTTNLDEELNDFTNFVRNSLDAAGVKKRRILGTHFNLFGFSASPTATAEEIATTRISRLTIPPFQLRLFGLGLRLSYSEKVLAAPLETPELNLALGQRFRKLSS